MRNSTLTRAPGRAAALAVLLGTMMLAGCVAEPSKRSARPGEAPAGYGGPVVAGHIEIDDLKESSGLAASQCQDVLWTLNDSGNDPLLFAMDTTGRNLGTWRVEGTRNVDWEAIAGFRDPAGACSLLIGDIGDNDQERGEVALHRIVEPAVSAATARSTGANPLRTGPPRTMTLGYPDGSHNAETLLVHPSTRKVYVVTKEKRGPAAVYRFEPAFGGRVTGEKVGEVSVPGKRAGQLTDGSFSPDGRRVMLCDEEGGYELVLPDGVTDPDAVWRQEPRVVDLGDRPQGEGVTYGRDGGSVYASSEKRNAPLYRVTAR